MDIGFGTQRPGKLPRDESEFQSFMMELDAYLQGKGLSAPFRQVAVIPELSEMVGRRGTIPQDRQPTPGVYSGEDLVLRALHWYGQMYGDKLAFDYHAGRTLVKLRGDLWIMRLPLFSGRVVLVCDADLMPWPARKSRKLPDGRQMINLLELIDKLPQRLAHTLTPAELDAVREAFIRGVRPLMSLCLCRDSSLVTQARADFNAAVQHLDSGSPSAGLSRWASLQAVEKLLKAFIEESGGKFPRSHDLEQLAAAAEALGLSPLDRSNLNEVQCSPSIRYGEPKVTLDQAFASHGASLNLADPLAEFLAAKRGHQRLG